MKTIGKLDKAIIDGQKLRTAREAKGVSVTAMAASLTLSRAQLLQIEHGGEKAFYNARHKMLATRKYASVLSIPFEEVVSYAQDNAIPESVEGAQPAIASAISAQPTTVITSPVDEITNNDTWRRRMLLIVGVLCLIISLYTIGRISRESVPSPKDPASEAQVRATSPGSASENRVKDISAPAAEIAEDDQTAMQLASQGSGLADPKSERSNISQELCQPEQAVNTLQTWSPGYQRKPGTRLYITSAQSSLICITDATGKSQLLDLKPMTGQAFSGKPPYTVRSTQLAQLEIYMQGMRVKIPSGTEAMKLVPNPITTPPPQRNNEIQAATFNP